MRLEILFSLLQMMIGICFSFSKNLFYINAQSRVNQNFFEDTRDEVLRITKFESSMSRP